MIETAVRAFLVADAGVFALVGTRIYPGVMPQSPTHPLITYSLISNVTEHAMEGERADNPSLALNCWSTNSYLEAKAVAAAVVEAMDGYRGTMNSEEKVSAALLKNSQDFFEDGVDDYRTLLEFSFRHVPV